MKKKTLNIILAVASLAIYGSIGYRVIPALTGGNEELPVATPVRIHSIDDFAEQRDTTSLKLNYGDPFGVSPKITVIDTLKHRPSMKKQQVLSTAIAPVNQDISLIKYAGYITNPGTGKTLVLLMINGKTVSLQEGESAEGVKVIKITKESVKILYRSHISSLPKLS
ncbi:hypothetical protein [Mucilaginibacter sp. 44-25]|uniref:hypothetical protein n=1 Tax=Mucilaginibacter sp. 44-25 TaxID=1895794 RepID=UPI0009639485|nr:hypothetical protein [Mucilaginibacter sp. 44-25]OJW17949.1 MAG: hypothetical protein BGO48_15310 [Mucilaginibacter sp. 44-25]